jgi:hypothetical protein
MFQINVLRVNQYFTEYQYFNIFVSEHRTELNDFKNYISNR